MAPLPILIVALLVVVGGVLRAKLHPFLVLVVAALAVAALTPAARLGDAAALPVGQRVAQGFGKTALDVGILIAMASILGQCLLEARGAERIVASLGRALGRERTPLAFLGAGFLLGIPMFAEAVFYLLLPLAKASWRETRRQGVLLVLSIVAGATMTHSLVPPTPGPLFVAEALEVDIAVMMRQGAIVGAVAALAGYVFARRADRRLGIPLRTADTLETRVDPGPLPPLWAALLPILLPVVLISADSAVGDSSGLPPWLVAAIRVAGDRNLALTISALGALALLVWQRRGDGDAVRRAVRGAVVEGGEIVLVIAAGGALGASLRQAGMAELAASVLPGDTLLLVPVAFLVTCLVRAAQGSATVAMITAAGIVGPIALSADLPYHPVYVALAIGCGSKPGMWMNDSGFWVIARMTGMTESETLRTASTMVAIEGVVGLATTMVLAAAWPLA